MVLSARTAFSGTSASASFSEGTDSPVNEASSIFKLEDSISLISAGTIFPSSIKTISPGTSSFVGISN